jgi:hypothetical protein
MSLACLWRESYNTSLTTIPCKFRVQTGVILYLFEVVEGSLSFIYIFNYLQLAFFNYQGKVTENILCFNNRPFLVKMVPGIVPSVPPKVNARHNHNPVKSFIVNNFDIIFYCPRILFCCLVTVLPTSYTILLLRCIHSKIYFHPLPCTPIPLFHYLRVPLYTAPCHLHLLW